LQPRVTAISNSLPFAAFDLILVATVAAFLWIVVAGVRGFRRGYRWRALGRAAVRDVVRRHHRVHLDFSALVALHDDEGTQHPILDVAVERLALRGIA